VWRCGGCSLKNNIEAEWRRVYGIASTPSTILGKGRISYRAILNVARGYEAEGSIITGLFPSNRS
jgi:hypothetical protein